MAAPAPSARTTVRRLPARAAYERATIDAILDEAVFCHLGFVVEGQPYVIPTIHARVGDRLYLHGSAASRMLRTLAEGVPVCATATLLDGLVLARSAFHHSLNYRSVVILGTAAEVEAAETATVDVRGGGDQRVRDLDAMRAAERLPIGARLPADALVEFDAVEHAEEIADDELFARAQARIDLGEVDWRAGEIVA